MKYDVIDTIKGQAYPQMLGLAWPFEFVAKGYWTAVALRT